MTDRTGKSRFFNDDFKRPLFNQQLRAKSTAFDSQRNILRLKQWGYIVQVKGQSMFEMWPL